MVRVSCQDSPDTFVLLKPRYASFASLPMSGGSVPSSRGKKRVSESRRKLYHIFQSAAGNCQSVCWHRHDQPYMMVRVSCADSPDSFVHVRSRYASAASLPMSGGSVPSSREKRECVRKSKKTLGNVQSNCRSGGWHRHDEPYD